MRYHQTSCYVSANHSETAWQVIKVWTPGLSALPASDIQKNNESDLLRETKILFLSHPLLAEFSGATGKISRFPLQQRRQLEYHCVLEGS